MSGPTKIEQCYSKLKTEDTEEIRSLRKQKYSETWEGRDSPAVRDKNSILAHTIFKY